MTARDTAPVDLDVLERLAREATPGPWWAAGAWFDDDGSPMPMVGHGSTGADWVAKTARRDGSDAAYIAAASPDVVLALVERVRAAEGALASVREAFDPGMLDCVRLGLPCSFVNPPDRWCFPCRVRVALDAPESAVEAPRSDAGLSGGVVGRSGRRGGQE